MEFQNLLADAGISSELHMLTAIQLITTTPLPHPVFEKHDRITLRKQAIKYLRSEAAKGNIEAKAKLITIFLEGNPSHHGEAEIWTRSIFDRRLSLALAACKHDMCQDDLERPLLDVVTELADADTVQACYLVGLILIDGIGVEHNVKQGVAYLRKAVNAGHSNARVELAAILSDIIKYPSIYDLQQSMNLYQKAVESTTQPRRLSAANIRAFTNLARLYYEGGEKISRDLDMAYKYARRVAEATGEQYCQYIVGDVLLTGNNQSIQEAVFWLTQSGAQGFPLAIESLSRIYFFGIEKEIKQDYEQAHEWCIRGDEIWPSGLSFCQTCLGDMYRSGLGVPKDLLRSFEYYQKAASQRDVPQNYANYARFMLGEMFFKGEDWPKNYAVAIEYYKLAAAENYETAQRRLDQLLASEEYKSTQIPQPRTQPKTWRLWSLFRRGKPTAPSSTSTNARIGV
ncbi:HCP-like protein [Lichtheimia hyalospora FSU 10163]|nr:HCP-like protein [Lichtheimia hyalospora FSU 10163]